MNSKKKYYLAFEQNEETKLPRRIGFTSEPKPFSDDNNADETVEAGETEAEQATFEQLQLDFFDQMLAFLDMLPMSAAIVHPMRGAWMQAFRDKEVEPIASDTIEEENWSFYEIDIRSIGALRKKFLKASRSSNVLDHLPYLGLMALVSQFDAYMGRLLRVAIGYKPHIVFESQKAFPAHEVFQYPDVESFKEAVIEKEIESFLRKSHESQFEWLKSTFKLNSAHEKLSSWPSFIEACERRNLFAQSNGIVSQQYLIKCAAAGVKPEVLSGEQLGVDPQYLEDRCKVFMEVGLLVAQTLSRVLDGSDEQQGKSDGCLNDITFSLIEHEHYDVATELLNYGCVTLKRHPDTLLLNMMIVNLANCYKLAGNIGACEDTLNSVDWKPFDGMFRISVASIREEVDEVVRLMPMLKSHEILTEAAYREWPVFIHVRDKQEFVEAFEEVYGLPFAVEVTKPVEGAQDDKKATVH